MDALEALLLPESWNTEFLAKNMETFSQNIDHIHEIV